MFGGFGRRRERDVGERRREQVQALKESVPATRAVNAEETIFDVPIPSASTTAVLRIQLPPQFPDHAPALRLLGLAIRHQWVDPGGLIAYHPRLNPWHSTNSLAEIVQQVIAEVTKTAGGSPTVPGTFNTWSGYPGAQASAGYPGQALAYQPGGGGGMMQPTAGGMAQGIIPQPPQQQGGAQGRPGAPGTPPPARPPIVLPALPTALPPELNDRASVDELNKLLSDEVAFSVFLTNLPQVKECNRQLEAIRRTNADLARGTLAQKDTLTKLKDEVTQLTEVMNDVKRAYEAKLKSNKAAMGGGGIEGGVAGVIVALEKETAAAEEASEATARAFISGDVKLPDFQSSYLGDRRKFHERSAKLEKIQTMQAQQQQGQRR